MADVASAADPEKWWPVTFVIEAIRGKLPEPNFELEEVARRLRSDLADLIDAMGPKYSEIKLELERRSAERIKRWQQLRKA